MCKYKTLSALFLCLSASQINAHSIAQQKVGTSVQLEKNLEQSLRNARAAWLIAREQGDAEGIDSGLLVNALDDQRKIIINKLIELDQASRKAGVRLIDEKLHLLSSQQKGRILLVNLEYERTYSHPLYGNKAVPVKAQGMAFYLSTNNYKSGKWYFPTNACFTADDVLERPELFFQNFRNLKN